ncbi:hypothetical protein WDU94_002832 [Cyamophila willieti]
MKTYTGKRSWFLTSLDIFGFTNMPNFFQTSWKNKLLKVIFNRILFTGALCVMSLEVVCTFIYSIHDVAEFLQKLLESTAILMYLTESWLCKFRQREFINLFDLQERVFTVSDQKLYNKYLWKEKMELKTVIFMNVLTICGLILETLMPVSERTFYLMTSIYHKKHPERRLPFQIWTPNCIDSSDKGPYVGFYLLEIYALVIVVVAIFNVTVLQIFIPTPLVAQYKMFAKFVQKIGMEHRDRFGENIFYTNVSTGEYLTETELLNYWLKNTKLEHVRADIYGATKRNSILQCTFWKKNKYQIFYVKKIIVRHQELNNFMNQYHQLMNSLHCLTVIPFFIVLVLSFYQFAYLKHLPWFYSMKILIEFLFIVGGMWHITTQSEMLNHCNEMIEKAVYNSQWYKGSPKLKHNALLILRNARTPKYFRFLSGLAELKYSFMLAVFKTAFSFLNFMKINGQL